MEILHGDCLDLFDTIESDSVSLVATSPPYKSEDGFSYDLIERSAEQIRRILKHGGLAMINFGQLAEEPLRPWRVACEFGNHLSAGPVISWVKSLPQLGGHFSPLRGNSWLNRKWEPIFFFAKGPWKLDRFAVGIPYKFKGNTKRWKHNREIQCGGDVWYFPYETIGNQFWIKKRMHPHQMPMKLCENMIKIAGLKDHDLILDPFAGSGTIGKAAQNVNPALRFLGFDINSAYCGGIT